MTTTHKESILLSFHSKDCKDFIIWMIAYVSLLMTSKMRIEPSMFSCHSGESVVLIHIEEGVIQRKKSWVPGDP